MKSEVRKICSRMGPQGFLVAAGVSSVSYGQGPSLVVVTKSNQVSIRLSEEIEAMCYSPNGSLLALGDCTALNVYSTTSNNILYSKSLGSVRQIVFSRDGSEIIAAVGLGDRYSNQTEVTVVLDAATGRVLLKLNVSSRFGLALSSGELLLAMGSDGIVLVEGLAKVVLEISNSSRTKKCCALTPDGKRILVGDSSGNILVYDISNRDLWSTLLIPTPFSFKAHSGAVQSLIVTANNRIICCSADKTIKIWDALTFDCLHVLEGHAGNVDCISVLNKWIVSGSSDKNVIFWRATV